jgi:hypothetical protein
MNIYHIAKNGNPLPLIFGSRDAALDWINREIRKGANPEEFEIMDRSDA